ncbi:hypothetical protein [Streptomyces zaomyceticus]|uniref:hypothetical protein n=1 Tax=Streptomyces zaomyceticus TaxID=68286 RepID=UPI002E20510A
MSRYDAPTQTTHIQGVGRVRAVQAQQLAPGDKVMWNGGAVVEVLAVAEASPCFLMVSLASSTKGDTKPDVRRWKKTAIIASPAAVQDQAETAPPVLPGHTWRQFNPNTTSRFEYLADHIEATKTRSGFAYQLMTTARVRNGEILRIPADIDDNAAWSRIRVQGAASELRQVMDQIREAERMDPASAQK